MDPFILYVGRCEEVLRTLPDSSVDSIVTDPPYEISFMGSKWDGSGIAFSVDMWKEALRVLKPGGHLLAFSATRTYHRMAVAIEDAGFEIREQMGWLFLSGFPKSMDVSKQIDKKMGAERTVVSRGYRAQTGSMYSSEEGGGFKDNFNITEPASPEAKKWEGWGTALKPAWEPIVLARKPLEGTVAENVLKYGTGAINIDGCRVGDVGGTRKTADAVKCNTTSVGGYLNAKAGDLVEGMGRWPATVLHDGSDEVLSLFPRDNVLKPHVRQRRRFEGFFDEDSEPSTCTPNGKNNIWGSGLGVAPPPRPLETNVFGDSAARFFYSPKAHKSDKEDGLEGFEERVWDDSLKGNDTPRNRGATLRKNHHPTVKPTDLMRYLVRLVTRKGGVVLDIFAGSGTTGKAAMLEDMKFIGIEMDLKYAAIAEERMLHVLYED